MASLMGSMDSIPLDTANRSLDAIWERSSTITQNIANKDTPNYKTKDVSFESSLSAALADNRLSESEVENLTPQMTTLQGSVDQNGNNVSVDSQMIELTRNQLHYNYLTKAVSSDLSMLSSAATEGKK